MVTSNSNSQKYPNNQAIQNDYPTVAPSVFGSSVTSVDTLINNMRVNLDKNPHSKAQWIKERQKVKSSALTTTDTIIIDGKNQNYKPSKDL